MKKKVIIIICIIVLMIPLLVVLTKNRIPNYPDDENTLYSIKFNNVKLRFERYDYVLGQNQLVGVQKSTNYGKDYKDITKEAITVSNEAKFVFLNERLGFAIKSSNLNKSNNYLGIYVTNDGGITFNNAKINYDNPNIEIITVKDVPYYDNDIIKLHCSIYQIKQDNSGYENVDLYFVSNDDGLTWNLELSESDRYSRIKSDIDKEMKRYLYYIAPNCNSDNAEGFLTHLDLVYNNGFDKEKLLDIDGKSYCRAYITYKCIEKGKWEWDTNISCKGYTDKNYKNFGEAFSDKK